MLEPGTVVERYRVLKELGEGGMGSVFLVEHIHLGSKHALKVLAGELTMKRSMRERFLREGRVMASLQHPNIARVTEMVTEGLAGLIMEYVPGPTLADWIDENGAQDDASCRAIMEPLLEAVGYAHEQRVVHRDLKPDNIILADAHGRIRPVILDFGIAKMLDGPEGGPARTSTGAMGTPGYMAPEQLKNARDADERTDIYALGLVLFELACGRAAFPTTGNTFADMQAVVEGHKKDFSEGAGQSVRRCVEQATAVAPAQRFPSCDAFAKTLKAAPPVPPRTPMSLTKEARGTLAPPPPRDPTPVPDAPARAQPADHDPTGWMSDSATGEQFFYFGVATAMLLLLLMVTAVSC
jgi:eukaryotic-like serine/threonine-protein kinase